MKTFVKSLPLIGPFIKRVHHWWKVDPARQLGRILRGRKDLYVVQIGSNDGITSDPVHLLLQTNPSWRALLIEPVPFLFERLCKTYSASPHMKFANVAIAERAGVAAFYYVDPLAKKHFPELPSLFDQLGSFDPDHISRHFGDTLKPFIVCTQVVTSPLPAVLDQNTVTKINLLHIDTEGYDWIVLRQLDLTIFRPDVILFEHKHLSENDEREALVFLRHDYRITKFRYDYLCRRK